MRVCFIDGGDVCTVDSLVFYQERVLLLAPLKHPAAAIQTHRIAKSPRMSCIRHTRHYPQIPGLLAGGELTSHMEHLYGSSVASFAVVLQ